MNNFKITRDKYSTNMATGSYVTSRENDLLSPDFGYSDFLHHIRGEKRIPAKSKFYDVP